MQGGWGWFDQQLTTVEGRVHEGFEHRCTDEPWIEGDTPALMLMGRALRGVVSRRSNASLLQMWLASVLKRRWGKDAGTAVSRLSNNACLGRGRGANGF